MSNLLSITDKGASSVLKGNITKISLVIALILIIPIIVSGCGKSPTAKATTTAQDQERLKVVSEFDSKIRPLFEASDASYQGLADAVRKYGYSEISKEQLVAAVNKAQTESKDLEAKVEEISAEGEFEEVKGGLSTCLYLRDQELVKLAKIVQQPKPKASELNNILNALEATESFYTKGLDKLEAIETQSGYRPGK